MTDIYLKNTNTRFGILNEVSCSKAWSRCVDNIPNSISVNIGTHHMLSEFRHYFHMLIYISERHPTYHTSNINCSVSTRFLLYCFLYVLCSLLCASGKCVAFPCRSPCLIIKYFISKEYVVLFYIERMGPNWCSPLSWDTLEMCYDLMMVNICINCKQVVLLYM